MTEGEADALQTELLAMLGSLIPDQQRRIELERLDAAEAIAQKLEGWGTNTQYEKAAKKLVKLIREKWAHEVSQT